MSRTKTATKAHPRVHVESSLARKTASTATAQPAPKPPQAPAKPAAQPDGSGWLRASMIRVLTFGVIAVFGIVAVLFLRDAGTASGVNWLGGN